MSYADLAKRAREEMDARWALIMKYGPELYEYLNDRVEKRKKGEL